MNRLRAESSWLGPSRPADDPLKKINPSLMTFTVPFWCLITVLIRFESLYNNSVEKQNR
jgi:hypothetical protein